MAELSLSYGAGSVERRGISRPLALGIILQLHTTEARRHGGSREPLRGLTINHFTSTPQKHRKLTGHGIIASHHVPVLLHEQEINTKYNVLIEG
jgi:hypothetical protein